MSYFESAAHTDRGRKRECNEDAVLRIPEAGVFCVADGMGGAEAGEVASATTVETIRERFGSITTDGTLADKARVLKGAATDASRVIHTRFNTNRETGGTGTTLVALVLPDQPTGAARILHAGDSRAYAYARGRFSCLTHDHSVAAAAGLKNERSLPSMFRGVVTRAIGLKDSVELETSRVQVAPGDVLMLCSDGLTRMLNDRVLERTMRGLRDAPLEQLARKLVDEANRKGGEDNISVVVVRIARDAVLTGEPDEEEKAPETADTAGAAPKAEGPTEAPTEAPASQERTPLVFAHAPEPETPDHTPHPAARPRDTQTSVGRTPSAETEAPLPPRATWRWGGLIAAIAAVLGGAILLSQRARDGRDTAARRPDDGSRSTPAVQPAVDASSAMAALRAEEERQRQEAEQKRASAEAERVRAAQEAEQQKAAAEAERLRRAAEAEQKRIAAEQEAARKAAEERRLREEEQKRMTEAAALEEAQKRAEAERLRREEERKAAEEAARRQREQEEAARQEMERQKAAAEAERRRLEAEAEQKRTAEARAREEARKRAEIAAARAALRETVQGALDSGRWEKVAALRAASGDALWEGQPEGVRAACEWWLGEWNAARQTPDLSGRYETSVKPLAAAFKAVGVPASAGRPFAQATDVERADAYCQALAAEQRRLAAVMRGEVQRLRDTAAVWGADASRLELLWYFSQPSQAGAEEEVKALRDKLRAAGAKIEPARAWVEKSRQAPLFTPPSPEIASTLADARALQGEVARAVSARLKEIPRTINAIWRLHEDDQTRPALDRIADLALAICVQQGDEGQKADLAARAASLPPMKEILDLLEKTVPGLRAAVNEGR